VDGNHVVSHAAGSTYGIDSYPTQSNLVVRNSCVGHAFNFTVDSDDTFGPIVTTVGMLATNGADAHPWANFSR
jgi:hypothetical protein